MTLLSNSLEGEGLSLEEQAQAILTAYLQEYWDSAPALDHPVFDLMRQITNERLKVCLILATLQRVELNTSLDIEQCASLMRAIVLDHLTYTAEEIQALLPKISSILVKDLSARLNVALFALVTSFESALRQADIFTLCQSNIEALYAQAHVWGNYRPVQEAYHLRVLLGDLLFADNAPGLASLLRQDHHGQSLEEQAQALITAYRQELENFDSIWISEHPALELLKQATSARLQVYLIRGALQTMYALASSYELPRRQITAIIDALSAENLSYTADDIQVILTEIMHIFAQEREARYYTSSPYDQEITNTTLFALLQRCEPFLRQPDVFAHCQHALASLYASPAQWGNYYPLAEAYRTHALIGNLLFAGDPPGPVSLLRVYAHDSSFSLEDQSRTLLAAYHLELGDFNERVDHPLRALIAQNTSELLKVRLIRDSLQEICTGLQKQPYNEYYDLPPALKQTVNIMKLLFSENLPYSREDIHSLLECMGCLFSPSVRLDGAIGDRYTFKNSFFLRMLNAFAPYLEQPEMLAFCHKELEQLYAAFLQYEWHSRNDSAYLMRLQLHTFLFPESRGPLRDLLQSRGASFESTTEIQALLAAYHQDLGHGTPSEMEPGIVQLLNKKLTPRAIIRLICLAAEEGHQLKALRELPGADEKKYLDEQDLLLLRSLCKKTLPLSPADMHTLLHGTLAFSAAAPTIGFLLNTFVSQFSQPDVVESCYEDLEAIQQVVAEQGWKTGYAAQDRQFQLRLMELLSLRRQLFRSPLLPDAWASPILAELTGLSVEELTPWLAILKHCVNAKGSVPSPGWLDQARSLSAVVERETFNRTVHRWISFFSDKKGERMDGGNSDILRGLIWLCTGSTERTLAAILADTAIEGYRKLSGLGPRCPKAGDAAVTTLESMPGRDAISQLERVRLHVKQPSYQAKVGSALDVVAQRENMTRLDLEELMLPTFDLQAGQLDVPVLSWTARLCVGVRKVQLLWIDPEGNSHSGLPVAVKRTAKEELKSVTRLIDDIEHLVDTQRDRLEHMFLHERRWLLEDWRERYLAHPLLGLLAQRLIWLVKAGEQSWVVIWHEGRLVDVDTQPVELPAQAEVTLWHPLMSNSQEVQLWCLWLEAQQVTQPFKQAHREIYPLTDAERASGRISLRFAGHFVRQHQLQVLTRAHDWHFSLHRDFSGEIQDDPATLDLSSLGLRAEFALSRSPFEDESIPRYLVTSQVRFPRLDLTPHGYYHPMQLQPLELIPSLVFSEVMRDVDLFVSVSSAGADPNRAEQSGALQDYWQNYNQSALSLSAETRKQVLARLVPRLAIAERCSLEERFLRVRGDLCTYRIHLGSGNVFMEPESRYLCIVFAAQKHEKAEGQFFLPFEGDQLLALILSKAFLLAEDSQIKDKSILSQISSR